MFTGLVEETGVLRAIAPRAGRSLRLTVSARRVLEGLAAGDSIAVNGVCLTVTGLGAGSFSADVMPETFRRTSLGTLHPGDPVNLERALALGGRLGGHLVQGHVDGTGRIVALEQQEIAVQVEVQPPPKLLRYVVPKGSVAVDGVSLTVADVGPDSFAVSLIPHTAAATTLGRLRVGALVNLETDILAKYVERLLGASPAIRGGQHSPEAAGPQSSGLTEAYLREHGF